MLVLIQPFYYWTYLLLKMDFCKIWQISYHSIIKYLYWLQLSSWAMVGMWFGGGGGTPSIMAEMETEMGKKSIIENRLPYYS